VATVPDPGSLGLYWKLRHSVMVVRHHHRVLLCLRAADLRRHQRALSAGVAVRPQHRPQVEGEHVVGAHHDQLARPEALDLVAEPQQIVRVALRETGLGGARNPPAGDCRRTVAPAWPAPG